MRMNNHRYSPLEISRVAHADLFWMERMTNLDPIGPRDAACRVRDGKICHEDGGKILRPKLGLEQGDVRRG
ncbi:uncharacterized protein VTP21DRAFT_5395 [Calcarisporiella thermophila]|uniref:uncharacterized protein n=1 Tax=Calcarisporiella thermophila TaxID=911321 RepID=UPI003741F2B7